MDIIEFENSQTWFQQNKDWNIFNRVVIPAKAGTPRPDSSRTRIETAHIHQIIRCMGPWNLYPEKQQGDYHLT
jgi:hypothetical protein